MFFSPIRMKFKAKEDDRIRNDLSAKVARSMEMVREGQKRNLSAEVENTELSKRRRLSNTDDDQVQFVGIPHRRNKIDGSLKKMERSLQYASKYAKEGNAILTQSWLNEARKYAVMIGSLSLFNAQASYINWQLHDIQRKRKYDYNYNQKEMMVGLSRALVYAKEGSKAYMEVCLQEARHDALNCDSIQAYHTQAAYIQSQLRNEKEYNLKKIEGCLSSASQHAKEGDKVLMDFYLEVGREYAVACNTLSAYYMRARNVKNQVHHENENGYYGTETVAENNVQRSSCTHTRRSLQILTNNKPRVIDALGDDDVAIEKVFDIDQVIAKRVQEAESEGEVIFIS